MADMKLIFQQSILPFIDFSFV